MEHKAFVFIELNGVPVPAGRLRITSDGRYSKSDFSYGRKYLKRPDAVAIDPVQLPLQDREMVTSPDFEMFNGIRDAAPDAWGRSLIDMYMMRSEGRPAIEAEYLLASQRGTRIGALQFGATPDKPGQALDISLPDISSDLGSIEAFQEMVDMHASGQSIPDSLLDHIAPGSDLGGARPKGTVEIEGFPWLAKFEISKDRINMAAAEAGCLDLCEMAGLNVCGRQIIEINGRSTLLLKRFDRKESPEKNGLDKIHMISSLTLLGQHEMDRGTSGYADIYDSLRRVSTSPDIGEDIYKRMVMNVLVGNTDDHYRNHAFLLGDDGKYRTSPVYDITPSLQVSSTRKTFLHLGKSGSGREATLENAIAAGSSLGVSVERSIEIANDLSGMVSDNWRKVMSDRGATQKDIEMMSQSFSQAGNSYKLDDPFNDTVLKEPESVRSPDEPK